MNFVSTGIKEVTRRLLRQRNRLALANARKLVERAEIALARHDWRDVAADETVRPAYESLERLDAEVVEAHARIVQLEERVREHEAERETARQTQAAELAEIEAARPPLKENLAAALARREQQLKTRQEQQAREAALQADRGAIDKRQKRLGRGLSETERQEAGAVLDARRVELTAESAAIEAARQEAVAPLQADEEEIKTNRAALAELDLRKQQAQAKLATQERAATLAIAGVLKEIAASRREAARVEQQKEVFLLTVGRRLATREEVPPQSQDLIGAARRYRQGFDRLVGLDAGWQRESLHANQQDLRIFRFVGVTLAVLFGVALLLILRTPAKRDWLPSNTEAIVSLNVSRFTNADFTRALQSQEPDTWAQVWTGFVQKVADVPQIDVRSQVARITHALAPSANHGPPVDYLLIQMRSSVDLDAWLRNELIPKGGFKQRELNGQASLVDGLPIYEKPGVAIAQIGPDTLTLGSPDAVEELIHVRLGLKEDLKSDAQFFSQFQRLDDDSAFRLVTDKPNELTYLTDPLLKTELLADCQALGLTIDLHEPASAVFLFNARSPVALERIGRLLRAQPDQVLQLQSAGPNLFIEPPSVVIYDNQLEWRFKMTAPAARAFLQRVSRLGLAPADGAVAQATP